MGCWEKENMDSTISSFLQILTVSFLMLIWASGVLGPLLWTYILLCTKYWILSIIYILWMLYDHKTAEQGGRNSEFLNNFGLGKCLRSYFPMKVIKTTELDSTQNHLLCYHPHGVYSIGVHSMFALKERNLFPGIDLKFLTLNMNFSIPIFRDLILCANGCSVSRKSLNYILGNKGGGKAAIIVPGGAREALYAAPGKEILYLNQRKGFIKVAIENGANLVPVFSFGENNLFSQFANPKGSYLRTFQEHSVKNFGAVPIVTWGNGFLPRRYAVTAVVGKPISTLQIKNPSLEYIDQIHTEYIEAVKTLYYSYRSKYGNPNVELTII